MGNSGLEELADASQESGADSLTIQQAQFLIAKEQQKQLRRIADDVSSIRRWVVFGGVLLLLWLISSLLVPLAKVFQYESQSVTSPR